MVALGRGGGLHSGAVVTAVSVVRTSSRGWTCATWVVRCVCFGVLTTFTL